MMMPGIDQFIGFYVKVINSVPSLLNSSIVPGDEYATLCHPLTH